MDERYYLEEPRLVGLMNFCRRLGRSAFSGDERYMIFQQMVRPELCELVGWNADGIQILKESSAYDRAIRVCMELAEI